MSLHRGRRGETDPVRNFWFYDTINVQQGLRFFSTYGPQSHIALGYTILKATLLGEERFLINYFVPNGPSCPDMGARWITVIHFGYKFVTNESLNPPYLQRILNAFLQHKAGVLGNIPVSQTAEM